MELIKIRRHFDRSHIPVEEIEATVKTELNRSGMDIPAGGRIAVAVGSRGIANLPVLVKAVLDWIEEREGRPFIVPAMGSHGGATAEGQRQVLESYGITETAMGVSVESSMETVELQSEGLPNKIYMDKRAYESDGTILINRVKIHTAFHGPSESGLMKMCVIGLGKHKGALELHSFGVKGLRDLVPAAARRVIRQGNIIGGLAVGENAYDQTALIKALAAEEIEGEEPRILDWTRQRMPSLPADTMDVLIVDEFGKNISGSGMDVNIIGRMKIDGVAEPELPKIKAIVLLDLADNSHGNASGMGLADVITRRVFEKIDFKATYENVLTHCFFERGKMPVIADTDSDALAYALKYCGIKDPEKARVLRIKNTLVLNEAWASAPLLEEISRIQGIEVTEEKSCFG